MHRAGIGRNMPTQGPKKADVVEHPKAFNHVGLRFDGFPGRTGPPFIQSSDKEPVCSATVSLHVQV